MLSSRRPSEGDDVDSWHAGFVAPGSKHGMSEKGNSVSGYRTVFLNCWEIH
jgi:hypothetical protein